MNNKSIEAIKSDIISLLDNVNNVVGCQKAMDAIAKLEGCAMTKDILEQTRIGKYVNELRKKTTDKNLSRRIKNLVRRWQEVVNDAGIDLNQPFKKAVGIVNGKHSSGPPSPSIPTSISQVNGKLKDVGVVKLKERQSQTRTSSPVTFSSSTPSPALSDPTRSRQTTPSLHLNGPTGKNTSPIVNNSPKSAFMPVPSCSLAKNKLSVINGHSKKIPTTPPTNISICDNKKASPQLAGNKRKAEVISSDSHNGVVIKKLKSSSSSNNLNNGDYNNIHIKKLEIEKSHNESNNQFINNKVYNNEDSNDSKSSQKRQKNGLLKGSSLEDKVFSCNSTGNLKCTISRSKPAHTPPITPSSNKFRSTQTPPIPSSTKFKSMTTPPVPSSLVKSKTPVSSIRSKTSNTPPIQSSLIKFKYANTPPIASTSIPDQKPLKKCATASATLHENFKPMVKHSKVETTAQILQKLHSNSNLPLSQTLEKIANNCIKRERSDDEEVSVVPQGIKPRAGKRKSRLVPPQSNAQEVAQAKDERMQIFLHSTSSNMPKNHSASNLEAYKALNEDSKNKLLNNVKSEDKKNIASKGRRISNSCIKPVQVEVKEERVVVASHLDPDSSEYRTALLKNPWAFLPPLDNLTIKGGDEVGGLESEDDGEVVGGCVGDGDIEERLNKLSLHRWSGVNGMQDPSGQWKDWTRSFSVMVNKDYCHILPYVCL